MYSSLDKLLRISVAAEKQIAFPQLDVFVDCSYALFVDELTILLSQKNGLYAFESALHFFPAHTNGYETDIHAWNASSLWREHYQGLADEGLFFAEDAFGMQFCAQKDGVYLFDGETGTREFLASTLKDFVDAVLRDYDVLTGHAVAHAWQAKHGALPRGQRLIPKVPFVLGGKFETENLYALESRKAMLFRASIATQIRDLPDGAQVDLKFK
jgi:hypothetical protein